VLRLLAALSCTFIRLYRRRLLLHSSPSQVPHLRTRRPLRCGYVLRARQHTGIIAPLLDELDINMPSIRLAEFPTFPYTLSPHPHARLFIEQLTYNFCLNLISTISAFGHRLTPQHDLHSTLPPPSSFMALPRPLSSRDCSEHCMFARAYVIRTSALSG